MIAGLIITCLYVLFAVWVAYKTYRNYDAVCLWMASDMAKGLLAGTVIIGGLLIVGYMENAL